MATNWVSGFKAMESRFDRVGASPEGSGTDNCAAGGSVTAGGVMVDLLVSRTILSGHLCSDLIRIVALSISGRSGKLDAASGKDQPAICRRDTSALPTTMKYLAMGTADRSRALSIRSQPVAATLEILMLRGKSIGDAAPPRYTLRKATLQLEKILLHHFPDVTSPAVQNRASRVKRHPDRGLYLHEWRHDELHRIDVHVQKG